MNLKNKFLVASIRMMDTPFARAVIYMLEHDEEQGAYGVTVNRKAEEVECTCGQCPKNPFPMYVGGPCDINSRITMLHGIERLGKEKYKIVPGLWHGTPKILNKIINTIPMDDHRFKMVTGYAGWAPGQLESEIAHGAWHVVDATPELVLDGDPDELWDNICPVITSIPGFSLN